MVECLFSMHNVIVRKLEQQHHMRESMCHASLQTASKFEGTTQQDGEVVQLYRSPGLSASATKTLLHKVSRLASLLWRVFIVQAG